MASRRFFGYDPYDLYYVVPPVSYPHPYYSHHHAAPARHAAGFFPDAEDLDAYFYQPAPARRAKPPAAARAAARPEARASRPIPIPVHSGDSDPEPEVARVPVKRAPSAEAAAVRIQAAARGFLARRAVRALRAVEREAEEVAGKVARDAEALRGDASARIGVGETLMRLLLRLDAVRGAREYRRRVARRVLALQDAVDALEQLPVPAAVAEDTETEAAVAEDSEAATAETTITVENEMAEGSSVVTDLPVPREINGEMEDDSATVSAAEMDVDGDTAAPEETADGANLGADKPADEDGEWEMVAEEPASDLSAVPHAPRPEEPAIEETTKRPAEAGGVDAKKLMEMVAALCEQSAQQCAVIGALAERVDKLERAVRRVEDAERRRRRAKKIKEGKGSNHTNKCYSD